MFYENILSSFQEKLNEILSVQDRNFVVQADLGIRHCQKTLYALKKKLGNINFQDSAEEIHFFKNIKVEPMRYLIYFLEIRLCEVKVPVVQERYQLKSLKKETQRINEFFAKHQELVLYMNLRYDHYDLQYFTRAYQHTFCLTNSYSYLTDQIFNTSHDVLWAKIKGYILYAKYLNQKIAALKLDHHNLCSEPSTNYVLEWTSSKAAAVELIYAIYSSHIIHQKYGIKDIAEVFEHIFNIDLGDYYHIYSEIRSRKVNRTKLIDSLKESLVKKMDESDE
ncbi:RteC domain-containing protein [Aquimarina sp. I32.4]|uniref:RteC domain-containing protein n=1 Tax=Aquimarina sp. I32.4 TaxID=2053903 RepID=UPI000CDF27D9|nr:RteC domain-containing protein [Aquimarina sp. I32.4]